MGNEILMESLWNLMRVIMTSNYTSSNG